MAHTLPSLGCIAIAPWWIGWTVCTHYERHFLQFCGNVAFFSEVGAELALLLVHCFRCSRRGSTSRA